MPYNVKIAEGLVIDLSAIAGEGASKWLLGILEAHAELYAGLQGVDNDKGVLASLQKIMDADVVNRKAYPDLYATLEKKIDAAINAHRKPTDLQGELVELATRLYARSIQSNEFSSHLVEQKPEVLDDKFARDKSDKYRKGLVRHKRIGDFAVDSSDISENEDKVLEKAAVYILDLAGVYDVESNDGGHYKQRLIKKIKNSIKRKYPDFMLYSREMHQLILSAVYDVLIEKGVLQPGQGSGSNIDTQNYAVHLEGKIKGHCIDEALDQLKQENEIFKDGLRAHEAALYLFEKVIKEGHHELPEGRRSARAVRLLQEFISVLTEFAALKQLSLNELLVGEKFPGNPPAPINVAVLDRVAKEVSEQIGRGNEYRLAYLTKPENRDAILQRLNVGILYTPENKVRVTDDKYWAAAIVMAWGQDKRVEELSLDTEQSRLEHMGWMLYLNSLMAGTKDSFGYPQLLEMLKKADDVGDVLNRLRNRNASYKVDEPSFSVPKPVAVLSTPVVQQTFKKHLGPDALLAQLRKDAASSSPTMSFEERKAVILAYLIHPNGLGMYIQYLAALDSDDRSVLVSEKVALQQKSIQKLVAALEKEEDPHHFEKGIAKLVGKIVDIVSELKGYHVMAAWAHMPTSHGLPSSESGFPSDMDLRALYHYAQIMTDPLVEPYIKAVAPKHMDILQLIADKLEYYVNTEFAQHKQETLRALENAVSATQSIKPLSKMMRGANQSSVDTMKREKNPETFAKQVAEFLQVLNGHIQTDERFNAFIKWGSEMEGSTFAHKAEDRKFSLELAKEWAKRPAVKDALDTIKTSQQAMSVLLGRDVTLVHDVTALVSGVKKLRKELEKSRLAGVVPLVGRLRKLEGFLPDAVDPDKKQSPIALFFQQDVDKHGYKDAVKRFLKEQVSSEKDAVYINVVSTFFADLKASGHDKKEYASVAGAFLDALGDIDGYALYVKALEKFLTTTVKAGGAVPQDYVAQVQGFCANLSRTRRVQEYVQSVDSVTTLIGQPYREGVAFAKCPLSSEKSAKADRKFAASVRLYAEVLGGAKLKETTLMNPDGTVEFSVKRAVQGMQIAVERYQDLLAVQGIVLERAELSSVVKPAKKVRETGDKPLSRPKARKPVREVVSSEPGEEFEQIDGKPFKAKPHSGKRKVRVEPADYHPPVSDIIESIEGDERAHHAVRDPDAPPAKRTSALRKPAPQKPKTAAKKEDDSDSEIERPTKVMFATSPTVIGNTEPNTNAEQIPVRTRRITHAPMPEAQKKNYIAEHHALMDVGMALLRELRQHNKSAFNSKAWQKLKADVEKQKKIKPKTEMKDEIHTAFDNVLHQIACGIIAAEPLVTGLPLAEVLPAVAKLQMFFSNARALNRGNYQDEKGLKAITDRLIRDRVALKGSESLSKDLDRDSRVISELMKGRDNEGVVLGRLKELGDIIRAEVRPEGIYYSFGQTLRAYGAYISELLLQEQEADNPACGKAIKQLPEVYTRAVNAFIKERNTINQNGVRNLEQLALFAHAGKDLCREFIRAFDPDRVYEGHMDFAAKVDELLKDVIAPRELRYDLKKNANIKLQNAWSEVLTLVIDNVKSSVERYDDKLAENAEMRQNVRTFLDISESLMSRFNDEHKAQFKALRQLVDSKTWKVADPRRSRALSVGVSDALRGVQAQAKPTNWTPIKRPALDSLRNTNDSKKPKRPPVPSLLLADGSIVPREGQPALPPAPSQPVLNVKSVAVKNIHPSSMPALPPRASLAPVPPKVTSPAKAEKRDSGSKKDVSSMPAQPPRPSFAPASPEVTSSKARDAKRVVVQNRGELEAVLQAKEEGTPGRVIFAFAHPKRGVKWEENLASSHIMTLFVFGDNVPMYNARKELVKAHGRDSKKVTKAQHDGKGQAKILGGYYRENVEGIPTCDFGEDGTVETAKALIGEALATIAEQLAQGRDVVLPATSKGNVAMATGLATQGGNRQPEGFKGQDMADYIDAQIDRVLLAPRSKPVEKRRRAVVNPEGETYRSLAVEVGSPSPAKSVHKTATPKKEKRDKSAPSSASKKPQEPVIYSNGAPIQAPLVLVSAQPLPSPGEEKRPARPTNRGRGRDRALALKQEAVVPDNDLVLTDEIAAQIRLGVSNQLCSAGLLRTRKADIEPIVEAVLISGYDADIDVNGNIAAIVESVRKDTQFKGIVAQEVAKEELVSGVFDAMCRKHELQDDISRSTMLECIYSVVDAESKTLLIMHETEAQRTFITAKLTQNAAFKKIVQRQEDIKNITQAVCETLYKEHRVTKDGVKSEIVPVVESVVLQSYDGWSALLGGQSSRIQYISKLVAENAEFIAIRTQEEQNKALVAAVSQSICELYQLTDEGQVQQMAELVAVVIESQNLEADAEQVEALAQIVVQDDSVAGYLWTLYPSSAEEVSSSQDEEVSSSPSSSSSAHSSQNEETLASATTALNPDDKPKEGPKPEEVNALVSLLSGSGVLPRATQETVAEEQPKSKPVYQNGTPAKSFKVDTTKPKDRKEKTKKKPFVLEEENKKPKAAKPEKPKKVKLTPMQELEKSVVDGICLFAKMKSDDSRRAKIAALVSELNQQVIDSIDPKASKAKDRWLKLDAKTDFIQHLKALAILDRRMTEILEPTNKTGLTREWALADLQQEYAAKKLGSDKYFVRLKFQDNSPSSTTTLQDTLRMQKPKHLELLGILPAFLPKWNMRSSLPTTEVKVSFSQDDRMVAKTAFFQRVFNQWLGALDAHNQGKVEELSSLRKDLLTEMTAEAPGQSPRFAAIRAAYKAFLDTKDIDYTAPEIYVRGLWNNADVQTCLQAAYPDIQFAEVDWDKLALAEALQDVVFAGLIEAIGQQQESPDVSATFKQQKALLLRVITTGYGKDAQKSAHYGALKAVRDEYLKLLGSVTIEEVTQNSHELIEKLLDNVEVQRAFHNAYTPRAEFGNNGLVFSAGGWGKAKAAREGHRADAKETKAFRGGIVSLIIAAIDSEIKKSSRQYDITAITSALSSYVETFYYQNEGLKGSSLEEYAYEIVHEVAFKGYCERDYGLAAEYDAIVAVITDIVPKDSWLFPPTELPPAPPPRPVQPVAPAWQLPVKPTVASPLHALNLMDGAPKPSSVAEQVVEEEEFPDLGTMRIGLQDPNEPNPLADVVISPEDAPIDPDNAVSKQLEDQARINALARHVQVGGGGGGSSHPSIVSPSRNNGEPSVSMFFDPLPGTVAPKPIPMPSNPPPALPSAPVVMEEEDVDIYATVAVHDLDPAEEAQRQAQGKDMGKSPDGEVRLENWVAPNGSSSRPRPALFSDKGTARHLFVDPKSSEKTQEENGRRKSDEFTPSRKPQSFEARENFRRSVSASTIGGSFVAALGLEPKPNANGHVEQVEAERAVTPPSTPVKGKPEENEEDFGGTKQSPFLKKLWGGLKKGGGVVPGQ